MWYLVVMTGKIDNGAEYFIKGWRRRRSKECEVISGPHDWDYVKSHLRWPLPNPKVVHSPNHLLITKYESL